MDDKQKTKILILDDEPIVLKRLKPALEKSGYDVEAFSRSLEASSKESISCNRGHCHYRICNNGDRQGILQKRGFRFFGKAL
jgi:DNA-binding NarL/FixJ family response regulator